MNDKNNFQKKVLILGGKPACSIDIVTYLKELGYYVIVADFLEKEQSPAKMLANESIMISTENVDELVNYVKEHSIYAVFTGVHEFNIKKCFEVCQKTGLPFYASKKSLEIASDKRKYKDIFKEFEIPVIQEYSFSLDCIPDNIEYPILLKPADGSGAYGIQLCKSKIEVEEKLQKTLQYSDTKKIIAEKYIENKDEITIVYIIKDGVPYLASVADRIVHEFENCIIPLPIAYKWNSRFLDLYEEQIDKKMKKAIQFMDMQNGMLFIQAIVKDSVIFPYDMGYRISATQEHVVIESVCGYNPLKILCDYAVSGQLSDETLTKKINAHFPVYAGQVTFLIKPAKIGRFEGIEDIANLPNVIRIIKNKFEGEVVPASVWGTLNQIGLRVFFTAPTEEELEILMETIRKTIKIYSDIGEDILIDVSK